MNLPIFGYVLRFVALLAAVIQGVMLIAGGQSEVGAAVIAAAFSSVSAIPALGGLVSSQRPASQLGVEGEPAAMVERIVSRPESVAVLSEAIAAALEKKAAGR